MTVAELLDRISSRELSEWMEFYGIEPFGFESEMLGHGITASTVANVNRKKGTKAVSPSEFIPKTEDRTESIDEAVNFIANFNAMHGGKDLRDGDDS